MPLYETRRPEKVIRFQTRGFPSRSSHYSGIAAESSTLLLEAQLSHTPQTPIPIMKALIPHRTCYRPLHATSGVRTLGCRPRNLNCTDSGQTAMLLPGCSSSNQALRYHGLAGLCRSAASLSLSFVRPDRRTVKTRYFRLLAASKATDLRGLLAR